MSNAVEISIQGINLYMELEDVCFNYYLAFRKMSTYRISDLADIAFTKLVRYSFFILGN